MVTWSKIAEGTEKEATEHTLDNSNKTRTWAGNENFLLIELMRSLDINYKI